MATGSIWLCARPSLAAAGECHPSIESTDRSSFTRMEHDHRYADTASCPVYGRQAEMGISVLKGRFRCPLHYLTGRSDGEGRTYIKAHDVGREQSFLGGRTTRQAGAERGDGQER